MVSKLVFYCIIYWKCDLLIIEMILKFLELDVNDGMDGGLGEMFEDDEGVDVVEEFRRVVGGDNVYDCGVDFGVNIVVRGFFVWVKWVLFDEDVGVEVWCKDDNGVFEVDFVFLCVCEVVFIEDLE